jgi:hypothetical protein
MGTGESVRKLVAGPMLVVRWLGVVVGVVAWLLLIPVIEVGRSVARGIGRLVPVRSDRRVDPVDTEGGEVMDFVEAHEARRAG